MRTKMDKIFDNSFEDAEYGNKSIKFSIAAAYTDNKDEESRMYSEMLISKIDSLIRGSEFAELNELDGDGKAKPLSKSQISKIYSYIAKNINDHSRIDIFAAVSDYFDIQGGKFYNCLSNAHKEELIMELDKKRNILETKRIRKLF